MALGLAERENVSQVAANEINGAVEKWARVTEFGGRHYQTQVKTLSTALTVSLGASELETGKLTQKKRDIKRHFAETLGHLDAYLKVAPIACCDLKMGADSGIDFDCRLYVSTYRPDSIKLLDMMNTTLFPPDDAHRPQLCVIVVPEWPEKDRQVLAFCEAGVTFVLGTDYYCEARYAFMRMAKWHARKQGLLALHAGTQTACGIRDDGTVKKTGVIMHGIPTTGRYLHSSTDHNMDADNESVSVLQDDVVFLQDTGAVYGSENAFYIKTDGPCEQYFCDVCNAIERSDTILENCVVGFDGKVYFADRTLTANGHALIPRSALDKSAIDTIDIPPLEGLDSLAIVFFTKSYTVVPIVSKLTVEQAICAFAQGESVDLASADFAKRNSAPKGIGAGPLVAGDPAWDCTRLYEILSPLRDKVECYLVNTGGVGEIVERELDGAKRIKRKVTGISQEEVSAVLRGILRDSIVWQEDSNWSVETPVSVPDIDISRFDPAQHYDTDRLDSLVAAVRLDRTEYIESLGKLPQEVIDAADY